MNHLRARIVLFAILLVASPTLTRATVKPYPLSPSDVQVGFSVDNLWGLVKITGDLTLFRGDLNLDFDQPEQSSVSVVAQSKSITTGWDFADSMLMGQSYLDVLEFPEIRFGSVQVETINPDHQVVHGHLTLRGITRDLDLIVLHDQPHEESDIGLSTNLSVSGSFNRSDFGMGSDLSIISDRVEFFIHTRLVLTPG
jgi:polyisoprenoid-binding protein YceI